MYKNFCLTLVRKGENVMSDVVEIIKGRVDELLLKFDSLKQSIDEAQEWNSVNKVLLNIENVSKFIVEVILAVEISVNDLVDQLGDVSSFEKLEAAIELLDQWVNLPWYLDIIDKAVFKIIVSFGVTLLNRFFGHEWDLQAAEQSLTSVSKSFIKEVSNN